MSSRLIVVVNDARGIAVQFEGAYLAKLDIERVQSAIKLAHVQQIKEYRKNTIIKQWEVSQQQKGTVTNGQGNQGSAGPGSEAKPGSAALNKPSAGAVGKAAKV